MKKIFTKVKSSHGDEIYSVMLNIENGELIDQICTCRYMSFDFWSKVNQERATLCKHILKICVEENIKLPKKFQTERNLKVIQDIKNGKEKNKKAN